MGINQIVWVTNEFQGEFVIADFDANTSPPLLIALGFNLANAGDRPKFVEHSVSRPRTLVSRVRDVRQERFMHHLLQLANLGRHGRIGINPGAVVVVRIGITFADIEVGAGRGEEGAVPTHDGKGHQGPGWIMQLIYDIMAGALVTSRDTSIPAGLVVGFNITIVFFRRYPCAQYFAHPPLPESQDLWLFVVFFEAQCAGANARRIGVEVEPVFKTEEVARTFRATHILGRHLIPAPGVGGRCRPRFLREKPMRGHDRFEFGADVSVGGSPVTSSCT